MPADYKSNEIKNLLKKFKEEYSRAPDPETIWNRSSKESFKDELDKYNSAPNGVSKVPRYFSEIGPLKYMNFVKHTLKNYRQLENTANSVYIDHEKQAGDRLYSEFQESTELKVALDKAVTSNPRFEDTSSDWNQSGKSRRELLMSGDTELHVVLKKSQDPAEPPTDKIKADGYSLKDLWKDKYHPINLTLSYDMFKNLMKEIMLQRKNSVAAYAEDEAHENTFKRHYLKYMFKQAESNQEFLLAVITFGTDIRFLPSKVMEFFQARQMLKDEFNSYKPATPLQYKEFTFSKAPDSVVPKKNAEFFNKFAPNPLANRTPEKTKSKSAVQIVKLIDLTEDPANDVNVDNFNIEIVRNRNRKSGSTNKTNERTPSSKSTNKGNGNGKSSKSNSQRKSGRISPVQFRIPTIVDSGTNIVKTIVQDVTLNTRSNRDARGKIFTISEDTFRNSTCKLWQMFFEPGFALAPAIAAVWYQRYLTHVKIHKDPLNNCVETLLNDRQRSCHYDIPRLHQHVVEMIKTDFMSMEMSRRNSGPFNMSTVEGIMYSQTSPLQLALEDPTLNKSVPGPTGWSPTNCDIPYQAFEGHLEWRLSETGKALDGLEIEMVKLRYAEYLSTVFTGGTQQLLQFVLGLFTAYGPDLYLYPTRVLQLIKKKKLIRPATKLHSMIQLPIDGRTYSNLVPMQNPPQERIHNFGGPPPFAHPQMTMTPMPSEIPPMGFNQQVHCPPAPFDPQMNYQNPPPPQQFQPPINNPNGFRPSGMEWNHNQGQPPGPPVSYMNHPNPQFEVTQQPLSVPPVQFNISQQQPQRQEPPKPSPLPSVLPLDSWKSACERSLNKCGPKYGIRPLSEKDYKVLYDRYLFDTFDNPDDFVRGILTGISLARYPRDDDDFINTSGLLKLPPASSIPSAPKELKPILKSAPAPPVENNAISRDDLLRVSNLLEKLIPSVNNDPTPTRSQPSSQESKRLIDYEHQRNDRNNYEYGTTVFRRVRTAAPISIPSRRNYEEEEMGYETSGRIKDYNSTSIRPPPRANNSEFLRRPVSVGVGHNPPRPPLRQPPPGMMGNMMTRPPRQLMNPYEDEVIRAKRMRNWEYEY